MALPRLLADDPADAAGHLAALNAPRPACLTRLRGVVLLQTCCCILAVDFAIFPRRFAKTEALATRSWTSASAPPSSPPRCHRAAPPTPRCRAVAVAARRHAPLLALGVGRLLAVRAASYHEAVGEYGVHWNAFLTLGVAGGVAASLVPAGAAACTACGTALLAAHQAALSLGVGEWALHAPREGLVSANKEGLASLPGYVALWWLARAAGAVVLRRPRRSIDAWWGALYEALGIASIAYVASVVADTQVQPGSRVLCNAAYVLWCLGQLLLALAIQLLVSLLDDGGTAPTPPLLAAINRQPLAVWLAANVMTGAVNIAMGDATAEVGAAVSLPVLVVYVAAVAAVAMAVEGEERPHLKQS